MPTVDPVAAVQSIIAEQAAAWTRGDADAWAACFSDDASFVNIMGMTLGGRVQIAERHGVMLRSVFRGSTSRVVLESLVTASPGVMLARMEHVVAGQQQQPPGIVATEPDGTLRTRMLYVLVRRPDGDDWQVIAAQNTAIVPAAVRRT